MAITKYKDNAPNPAVVTIADCVERLITESLQPHFTPGPWQSFRDEELWTREVNLVFYDNREGLKKLYH